MLLGPAPTGRDGRQRGNRTGVNTTAEQPKTGPTSSSEPATGNPGTGEPGSATPGWTPGSGNPGTGDPGSGEPGPRATRAPGHATGRPSTDKQATEHQDAAKGARTLAVLPTLRGYKVSWLTADSVAGLTLVAIAIPEQVATAHLANMPAVTGFYAFVAGSVLFALFGRHPRMSVGADSTIAPVFAAGVATLAVAGSPTYAHLVSATALIVGVLLVIAGLLRLGWIADFFPLPVVTGLLAGIGLEIFVKQLPTVLGLPGGGTTTIGRVKTFFQQLGHFNPWAFGIAVAVLGIILIADEGRPPDPGGLDRRRGLNGTGRRGQSDQPRRSGARPGAGVVPSSRFASSELPTAQQAHCYRAHGGFSLHSADFCDRALQPG